MTAFTLEFILSYSIVCQAKNQKKRQVGMYFVPLTHAAPAEFHLLKWLESSKGRLLAELLMQFGGNLIPSSKG